MRDFLRRLFCAHEWSHPTRTEAVRFPHVTFSTQMGLTVMYCGRCRTVKRIGSWHEVPDYSEEAPRA